MDRKRAFQILEAYGGHPAAWPEEERAEAERLIMSDQELVVRTNEARAIDRALIEWAQELPPLTAAEADAGAEAIAARALGEIRQLAAPRRWWPRAAFGGALAASLAVGAILLARPDAPTAIAPSAPKATQIALNQLPGEELQVAHDMLVWGSVFTPTPEEETML